MYRTAYDETISRVVARYIILPAVRANTSLQTLSFVSLNYDESKLIPELEEAQDIVTARALLDAQAMVRARTAPDGGVAD